MSESSRLPRRQVLQFFAGTSILLAGGDPILRAQTPAEMPAPTGYGTDPDLLKIYKPGDVWPLTMTPDQKSAAIAFADLLLPADELGPAASELRVADYIDEWVSAPYPVQKAARPLIIQGLDGINAEAQKQHQVPFAKLSAEQQLAFCDHLSDPARANNSHPRAHEFFQSFRNLAMGAYYATPAGWKAIGYVGNQSMASFDGPPPEVLKILGVEQTVK